MAKGITKGITKGIISFDSLFSILPIALMAVYVLMLNSYALEKAASLVQNQELFNKLTSIADYAVNKAAAHREGEIIYPNWIDDNYDFGTLEASLKSGMELEEFSIRADSPGEGKTCIYRLVVVGGAKEIKKLYFCGS